MYRFKRLIGNPDFTGGEYLPWKYICAMISISNISYFIGGRVLYENASAFVKPKDKTAWSGWNGRGKSTLLKVDSRWVFAWCRLDQQGKRLHDRVPEPGPAHQTEDSILTVAGGAFKEVVDIERQLEHIIKQLETGIRTSLYRSSPNSRKNTNSLMATPSNQRQRKFWKVSGFVTADLHRPLKEFSGGWRMRVMLAKLLLEKPSLLMLDEPTNHLDFALNQWVENTISQIMKVRWWWFRNDRQFLDNVTTKTIGVSQSQLFTYEGNYSFYLEEKELRQEIQQNAFENQQAKIRQTERFIERFKSEGNKSPAGSVARKRLSGWTWLKKWLMTPLR